MRALTGIGDELEACELMTDQGPGGDKLKGKKILTLDSYSTGSDSYVMLKGVTQGSLKICKQHSIILFRV